MRDPPPPVAPHSPLPFLLPPFCPELQDTESFSSLGPPCPPGTLPTGGFGVCRRAGWPTPWGRSALLAASQVPAVSSLAGRPRRTACRARHGHHTRATGRPFVPIRGSQT